ncbi:hypothetical protein LMJF_32_0330 [Leishmania major strain Friedlin]|uniref:Uncharacterized protein n=1 Tax=Leishmania major TaxID=5664 RepID=Q4Q5Q2_LEIMA|nr:hypothetical protein LMJF_32_0330 [Leishmania major strain Friedlin]CAG9579980.1 hypothetical_protein_-_conserved [Leishmania major strain Friedlin]CAJ08494.1 hypothetical protein LMJF_32_0330 [Leishmania major strain Friedlin]|eukprot:XP_001685346.1 hypothetical protein LMJF_32_0330 [Leishmania major strain Friedlin]
MRAESVHRTSSVRTSSSHRSTIETRGAPEFDREYARQLSLAKRGRNSSVKTSQRTTPEQELPSESQLYGSAALAASRIKDYVATHVTPPRLPHLSSARRSGEHGGTSIGASNVGTTHQHSSQALATPTSGKEGAGSETPLFLNSTRRGSAFDDTKAPTEAMASAEVSLLLFSIKTILFVGIVFFTVLCAISFVVSASADYNPSYFAFSGASSTPRPRLRDDTVGRRGWPDRLVPEFHRQVALHMRRALRHVLSYVDVPSFSRLVGSVLAASKAYMWNPVHAMLPRIDRQVHPVLRYIFLNATEDGKGWGLTTVITLAASVARSLVQLLVDPVLIVGCTLQALHRWLGGPMTLLSTSLKPLHATPGNMSSVVAAAKANGTSVTTRAASSALLWLWRPLHSLWGVTMSAYSSLGDIPEPRNYSTSAATPANASTIPNSSPLSNRSGKTLSRTSAEVTPCFVAAHVEVRTAHARRLEGALWPSLLDAHRHEMEGLAKDDVWELLRGEGDATRRVDVALRAGSLVIDIAVTSQVILESTPRTAGGGVEKTTGAAESARRARQTALNTELQQWPFPRLQAFYNRAVSTAETQRTSAATLAAAVAACEGRVTKCQQQCASIQRKLERELHNCTSDVTKSNPSHANASEEATKELSALLRECSDELANCHANLSWSTADLAEQERHTELRERGSHESQLTLAASRQGVTGAAAVLAEGFSNSDEERQRCAASLAAAAQECDQRVRDTRSSLDADHAKQLTSFKEECARQRSALDKASLEKVKLAVQRAEATCSEQLKANVAACNESAASALERLREALTAAKAEAERRVTTCEDAAEQARVSFSAERAQLDASCAAQLAALDEEMRRTSTAAAQKAETACTGRLSRGLSALNSSAVAAASELQRQLEEGTREALRSASACDTSRRQAKAECEMTLTRVREDCTAQLLKARENSTAAARRAREEEREAQQRISASNWRLEEKRLAAQCAATTQAAVSEASQLLATKHATAQEEAVIEERRRTATLLRRRDEAYQLQSETLLKHHQAQVRDLGAQVAVCTAQLQAAEATHQEMAQKARQVLHAAMADSATGACLEVTQHNLHVCADVRKAVQEELHKLPLNASSADAFAHLLKSTVEPGRLMWKFSGASVHASRGGETAASSGRQACFTPYLRVSGVLFALLASACVLAKYPRTRRLSDDKIARLDTLIAASKTATTLRSTTLSSRSKRSRSRHPGQFPADGESPLSWDVLFEACMANSLETLLAWHSTCCAVLLERETHRLRGQPHEVNTCEDVLATDASTSLSESVLGDAHALSLSRGGPAGSLSSASTFPVAREDAARLSQLHAAFINGYYDMLEMYYVDLVSAVAHRDLTGRQLQDVKSVAARQAAALQKQSAVAAQLKLSLAEKENPASFAAIKDKLAKVERCAAAQEETVALLEQLKISRDELDKARGVVSSPAPSPCTTVATATATAPESSKSRQMRSLQELADDGADGDSNSTSDFSNLERETGAHRDPTSLLPVSAQGSSTLPLAIKKSTMVRNPDSTRRYHKLQWNDDVDMT